MAKGCAKTRNQPAPENVGSQFLLLLRLVRLKLGVRERNERPNRSPNGLPNLLYTLFTTGFSIM